MGDISVDLTIPEEYKDELEPVEVSEHRSHEEILESLGRFTPVTSEKTIWGFWHAGLEGMPSWCQRNVVDWVRINPGWPVRILDNIPDSPHYAMKYVSADLLPAAFVERRVSGCVGPHSADLLRGAVLYTYGGAWLDVGAILSRSIDRICWSQLEDPETPFRVAAPHMFSLIVGNHFIVARKGDPFIKCWHDLFVQLWDGKTGTDGMLANPLIASSVPWIVEQYEKVASQLWDWAIPHEQALEYVTQIACWWHVCSHEDNGNGFSPADYWQKHVYLFSTAEDWPAEGLLGFARSGQKIVDLLALRRDGDRDTEQYRLAEKLVWTILARSSMQKVTHGAGMTLTPLLGTLWDMPENEGKDCEPGTFGELLRYGSVHLRQKREIQRINAPKPEHTFKKGLLEPDETSAHSLL